LPARGQHQRQLFVLAAVEGIEITVILEVLHRGGDAQCLLIPRRPGWQAVGLLGIGCSPDI
jgi:hypothetical protein